MCNKLLVVFDSFYMMSILILNFVYVVFYGIVTNMYTIQYIHLTAKNKSKMNLDSVYLFNFNKATVIYLVLSTDFIDNRNGDSVLIHWRLRLNITSNNNILEINSCIETCTGEFGHAHFKPVDN